MNLYQAFNQNPINVVDPMGLEVDLIYFDSVVHEGAITENWRERGTLMAEGAANLIPSVAYWMKDVFEIATGDDLFDEDWRLSFNFSNPGPVIQINKEDDRSYLGKIKDATVVYPTGEFLGEAGANFIMGYGDSYFINKEVGLEARENLDRQAIPLALTGYGIFKGKCKPTNKVDLTTAKNTKISSNKYFRKVTRNILKKKPRAKRKTKIGENFFKEVEEFHHRFIPNRTKWAPNWIKHSKLNLKRLFTLDHARIDPYRFKFMPKWIKEHLIKEGSLEFKLTK